MFIEPTVLGQTFQYAADVYKNRNNIISFTRKLAHLVRYGFLHVSVFGEGGTGKTYLGELLEKGEINPELFSKPYEESLFPENKNLGGPINGAYGKIIVPPGQKRRAETWWHNEYEELSRGKSTGIINVVSWGYHSFGDPDMKLSYKDTKYYKSGMSALTFLKGYTEERRRMELSALKEIVPHLIDADKRKKIWMITLVTKQDIWWKNRNLVRNFYVNGTYNNYIEQIGQLRGAQNFQHEYLSAALVMRNFTTEAGEVLATITPGYDQAVQYAHINRLLNTINNFAEKIG